MQIKPKGNKTIVFLGMSGQENSLGLNLRRNKSVHDFIGVTEFSAWRKFCSGDMHFVSVDLMIEVVNN
jgi:hypothetical protein